MANKNQPSSNSAFADQWKSLLSDIYAPAIPNTEITLDYAKARLLVSNRLVDTVENADILSHGECVSKIAYSIGAVLGLSEPDLFRLKIGGLFHDIGKTDVPQGVLQKPGELSTVETAILRQHVFSGALAVSCLNEPLITQIVFFHQEHYDGSGYLCGLQGSAIPKLARIVSVADAFAAMITSRCYQEAISISDSVKSIRKYAGTQFDPEIVSAFVSIYNLSNNSTWFSSSANEHHRGVPSQSLSEQLLQGQIGF